jgi:NAD(P)H-quinone oxidoreductase subunit 6
MSPELQTFMNLAIWAQANVEPVAFLILGILAIPMAFGVIFDRMIIRAGFVLIGVFGAISGLFLLLQAQFLALAQIMIYAVGITLVVVIALMLTNPKMEEDMSVAQPKLKLPALFASVLLFVTIFQAVVVEPWRVQGLNVHPDITYVLGRWLMTFYSLPFEFASVLLLAALIGAVMLAKAEPKNIKASTSTDEGNGTHTNYVERTDDVVKV